MHQRWWLQWVPWCLSIVKVLDFLTSKFSYTQQEYDSNLLCVLFLSLPLDSLPPWLNQTHGIPATSRETKAITKYSGVWSRFGSFIVVTFSCRYPRRAVSHKTSSTLYCETMCMKCADRNEYLFSWFMVYANHINSPDLRTYMLLLLRCICKTHHMKTL